MAIAAPPVKPEADTPVLDKPASVSYPVHELIQQRWSPRAFVDKSVALEKVCSLLEAARWAPSCYNEQPWRFFVGHKSSSPEAWQTLFDLLVPFNQQWCKNAPLLILSVCKKTFSHSGDFNAHAEHDCGMAFENVTLQAVALGLVSHQMAGYNWRQAPELLSLPPDFKPMTMMAVGYQGQPSDISDTELRAQEAEPRQRKTLQEITLSTRWGQPFSSCFN